VCVFGFVFVFDFFLFCLRGCVGRFFFFFFVFVCWFGLGCVSLLVFFVSVVGGFWCLGFFGGVVSLFWWYGLLVFFWFFWVFGGLVACCDFFFYWLGCCCCWVSSIVSGVLWGVGVESQELCVIFLLGFLAVVLCYCWVSWSGFVVGGFLFLVFWVGMCVLGFVVSLCWVCFGVMGFVGVLL